MQGNAETWIKLTLMLEEYLDGPNLASDLIPVKGRLLMALLHATNNKK